MQLNEKDSMVLFKKNLLFPRKLILNHLWTPPQNKSIFVDISQKVKKVSSAKNVCPQQKIILLRQLRLKALPVFKQIYCEIFIFNNYF